MSIDKEKLKGLAERSILGHPSAPKNLSDLSQNGSVYRASTRPPVVLALLSEIERLEREEKNDLIAYKAAIERQKELRAERDQLRSENKRLMEIHDHLTALRETDGFTSWSEVLCALSKYRKDAERYRWLRQKSLPLDGHDFLSTQEILDRRIDAAMAKERAQ